MPLNSIVKQIKLRFSPTQSFRFIQMFSKYREFSEMKLSWADRLVFREFPRLELSWADRLVSESLQKWNCLGQIAW